MADPKHSVVRCRDDLCSPRAVWRCVDDVVHGIYSSLLDMLHGSATRDADEDASLVTGRNVYREPTAGRTCGR